MNSSLLKGNKDMLHSGNFTEKIYNNAYWEDINSFNNTSLNKSNNLKFDNLLESNNNYMNSYNPSIYNTSRFNLYRL